MEKEEVKGSSKTGPAKTDGPEPIPEDGSSNAPEEKAQAPPVHQPPPAPARRAIPGTGFLSTTKGKIIALILVVVIIGAIASFNVSFTWSVEKTTTTSPEINTTVPEDYYAEETLSFSYGHRRAPISTSQTVTFPVEGNASKGSVETEGDPGSPRRFDGGDRKEVDIEVIGANGNTIGTGATPQMNELVEMSAADMERGGVGNWQVIVDCYSGTNVQVTVKITVTYALNNTTAGNGTANDTMVEERYQETDEGTFETEANVFIERDRK